MKKKTTRNKRLTVYEEISMSNKMYTGIAPPSNLNKKLKVVNL